jgi:hypothetical protein
MERWVTELNAWPEPSARRWLLRRVCALAGHRDAHVALEPGTLEPVPGERLPYRYGTGECTRCGTWLVIEELG